jgi:hypothetical protein
MEEAEVLGIELVQYVGYNLKALVPRVIGQTEVTRQKNIHVRSHKKPISQQEFLASCPEYIRAFFTQAIAEWQQPNMRVHWGNQGFSLQAEDTSGKRMTLFYTASRGGPSKDLAIAGYIGDIDDVRYRDQVRQRLLEIPGTIPSGQYTVILELNERALENAVKLLKVVWEISRETSKPDGQENRQA